MSLSPEFAEHLRDLFAGLGPVATRRMFGGAGLFVGDAMFGLVFDDVLFLKADDALASDLQEAGSEPFTYRRQSRERSLGFWRLPESALDDPEEALAWARRALVPAEAAAVKKRARKARRQAAS